MYSMRSLYRTLSILSHAPLAGPAPLPANSPFAGTPLTTFRTYATTQQAPQPGDLEKSHEQSGPQAPSTDEIAQSESAYSDETDPGKEKQDLESETSGSMNQSAADSRASEAPQKPLGTSKREAQKSGSSQ